MSPERLADVLASLGWTQARLADHLGVSGRMVRHYLAGRSPITVGHATQIEALMAAIEVMPAERLLAALRALRLRRTGWGSRGANSARCWPAGES